MPDEHIISELKQDIACLRVNNLRQRITSICRAGNEGQVIEAVNALSQKEFKDRWGFLRRVLFEALNIPNLSCIDRNPISILVSALDDAGSNFLSHIEEVTMTSLRKQVELGNTFFIDIEKLRKTQAAILIPEIASTRIEKLRDICRDSFDPRKFVQTYYGFKLVSSRVRNGTFAKELPGVLEKLGVTVPSDICTTVFDFDTAGLEFDNVSARTHELLCEILRLTGNNSGERAKAAETLGIIGDPRAEPYIRAATQDRYVWVKKAAIEALGKIRLSSSIDALVECLYDLESSVREKAARNLPYFGNEVVPQLVSVLDHDRQVHFENALEEAEASHPRSLDTFAAALLNRNSEAKRLAREVLSELNHSAEDKIGLSGSNTTLSQTNSLSEPID
ncbi:MAG: HEAT repeat domain-containing protein [Candidatus Thorarchaeota archaeon]